MFSCKYYVLCVQDCTSKLVSFEDEKDMLDFLIDFEDTKNGDDWIDAVIRGEILVSRNIEVK